METKRLRRFSALAVLFLVLVALAGQALAAPLSWQPAAPLPVPVSRAASAVFEGRLYVLGGLEPASDNNVFMFDPAVGQWMPRMPLFEARFASAGATHFGTAYMAGGFTAAPGNPESSILAYDLQSGATRIAGQLQVARARASAAELNGRIYIFGGDTATERLDSLEEFDPVYGTSFVKYRFPEARSLSGLVALGTRLYVIGGLDNNGMGRGNCWEYDPALNHFVPKAPMPIPCSGWASVVANGKIYVVGGVINHMAYPVSLATEIQEYDPSTDMWRIVGNLPTPRYAQAAGVLNNTLYAVGGDGGTGNPPALSVTETASLATTAEWVARAPMPFPVQWSSSAAVGGSIYVLGGDSPAGPTAIVQKYEALPGAWTPTPPLPAPLAGAAAAAQGDRIFLAGGHFIDPDNQMALSAGILAYDVTTGSTAPIGTLQLPRHWAEADILNGAMYVAGGEMLDNTGLAYTATTMERIDLATGASTLIPMPAPRSGAAAIAMPPTPQHPGGRLLVFGGYTGYGGFTGDSFAYDPATGSIAPIRPMPYPGLTKGAGVIGTKAYVVLSHDLTGSGHSPVLAYDAAADTWEEVSAVPSPRDGAEAKIVAGTIYVIGGTSPAGMGLNESLALSSGWSISGTAPGAPFMIDWPAAQHPPVTAGSYLNAGGAYYYVLYSGTGSWTGPDYVFADLQQCDQVTGIPLGDAYGGPLRPDMTALVGSPLAALDFWPVPADLTPPVTTSEVWGPLGQNGWYVGQVWVSLTASDNPGGSGVQLTEYAMDGSNWFPTWPGSPLGIGASAPFTLWYRSRDFANNLEDPPKSVFVRVDAEAPTTRPSSTCNVPGNDGWCRGTVTVSLQPFDAVSGVMGTTFAFDGGGRIPYFGPFDVSPEGVSAIVFGSQDFAGNLENDQAYQVMIDRTPPSVLATREGTPGQGGWYVSDVRVVLSANDALSGVGSIEYSFDGSTWNRYNQPLVVSTPGPTLIHCRATDGAGNIGLPCPVEIRIDKSEGIAWSTRYLPGGEVNALVQSPGFATDRTAFAATETGGIYRTIDGGATWTSASTGLTAEPIRFLAISPDFPGDRTLFAFSRLGSVYRSTDAGSSWLRIYASNRFGIGESAGFVVSPAYATDRTLYAAWNADQPPIGDGQLHVSNDGGYSWRRINYDVMPMAFHSLAISPGFATDGTLVAGTDHQVVRSLDRGASWHEVFRVGANFDALDFSPDYASDRTILAGTRGAGMFRSTDGGTAWAGVSAGLPLTQYGTVVGVNALLISPAAASGTVFAGTEGWGLFSSADRGASWSPVAGGFDNLAVIRALSASRGFESDRALMAGTATGKVWISSETLRSPVCTLDGPAAGAQLTGASFTISGTASDGGGSGVSRVEVSVDGGASWTTAAGTGAWRYEWALPTEGAFGLTARAVDYAGNVGAATPVVTVLVDNAPPAVDVTVPSDGQTSVPVGDNIVIRYTEAVKAGPNFGGITLKKGKNVVAFSVRFEGNSVVIDPAAALSKNSLHVVTIPAGALADAAGNATTTETKLGFTTARR